MGNPMDLPDGTEQTQKYEVRGLEVRLTNTRPDIDSGDVLDRLRHGLCQIQLFRRRLVQHVHRKRTTLDLQYWRAAKEL